ncbi:MAG: LytTR family DNA-binding domain-containing protein [Bacteroidota bacterium]|nr:LytTR family DNA-binding domain-containing protein [Bacteroidota bacterium]
MAKILIIDDDQPVRSGIRDLLEVKNYTVFTVDNGLDGIRIAKEIDPDLILCDIIMPKMDGYKVLAEIKKEPALMLVPFIYLTSKTDMADMRYGMGLGADDYIIKPFAAKDLYRAIETRLNKQQLLMQQMINKKKEPVSKLSDEKNQQTDHLFLPVGNEIQYIKIQSIECITAFSEYTNVYVDPGKKIVVRKFLKEWEKFLPHSTFLRIHRSTIINLDFVVKIEKFFKRSYIVHLKNIKQPFTISQRFAAKLKSHNLF